MQQKQKRVTKVTCKNKDKTAKQTKNKLTQIHLTF